MNSKVSSSVDVAIVGAGVAGLACALGLARSRPDKRSMVLGQASRADQILTLTPRSVDFLESIGVRVRDRARAVHRMRVFSGGNRGGELRFDAADAGLTALSWVLPQAALQEQLEALCAQHGIARLAREVNALAGPADTPDRKIRLLGEGLEVTAQVALGADGAQSALREAAGIACEQYFYPQKALVAQLEWSGAEPDCAYQWFGEHGILALLPMAGGQHCMIWSVPVPASPSSEPLAAVSRHEKLLSCDESDFLSEVSAVVGPELGTPKLVAPRKGFPLRRFLPEKLIAGRIALMGDAAHVVHPLAGQGLNLGLGDVEAFVGIMAALPSAMDLGEAIVLRRYARARAEPIAVMATLTHGLQKVFEGRPDPDWSTRLVRLARDLGWRGVNQLDPLKQALIRHASS